MDTLDAASLVLVIIGIVVGCAITSVVFHQNQRRYLLSMADNSHVMYVAGKPLMLFHERDYRALIRHMYEGSVLEDNGYLRHARADAYRLNDSDTLDFKYSRQAMELLAVFSAQRHTDVSAKAVIHLFSHWSRLRAAPCAEEISDASIYLELETALCNGSTLTEETRMVLSVAIDALDRIHKMGKAGKKGWTKEPFENLAVSGMKNLQGGSYLDTAIFAAMLHYRKSIKEDRLPDTNVVSLTDPASVA